MKEICIREVFGPLRSVWIVAPDHLLFHLYRCLHLYLHLHIHLHFLCHIYEAELSYIKNKAKAISAKL